MWDYIPRPLKGGVYQSAYGPRRLVMNVDGEEIIYRVIGKASSNRSTHIACWQQWCNKNLAFLVDDKK